MFEVKTEILDTHEALLTVEIDPQTSQKALEKVAREISREIKIPGFRKGRVPFHIVERAVGSDTLRQEAAEVLLKDIYPQILEEADIQPYTSGRLEGIEIRPFVVTIRVPLAPEVELGDYESLRMDPEPTEVTEEELQAALERIRIDNAILDLVERPAEMGDLVILSLLEGRVGDEVVFHDHDVEVVLDEEEPFISVDFVTALVGMREEEEKTFTLVLPEDFVEEELRGEEIEFEVTVAEVYNRSLPEIDDALASAVGNYESLEELKANLQEQMSEYKEEQAEAVYREKLVNALIEMSEVHYPPEMVEDTIDDILAEMRQNIEHRYDVEWKDFLRRQGISEDQLREQVRSQAVDRIQRGLVLGAFAEEVGIEVTEAEIREQVANILRGRGIADENLVSQFKVDSQAGENVRATVRGEKTLRALERLAQGLSPLEPEPEIEPEVWVEEDSETSVGEAQPESPPEVEEDEVAAEDDESGVDEPEHSE